VRPFSCTGVGGAGFLAEGRCSLASVKWSLQAPVVQARYSSSTDEDEMEDMEADDDEF
jgi:hypothetical protein